MIAMLIEALPTKQIPKKRWHIREHDQEVYWLNKAATGNQSKHNWLARLQIQKTRPEPGF
ncbi:hypothetical protein CWE12_05655 [Aliidiomarina sedimenti]|uniref:Uncharacterized protein n=1 Tax=Aliidiomarina sedimenti TaxID=1933879 RepID=A0ABY0BZX4_9GAMM|nr:hypothetical protein CWE12_05655 [Aliidiomarina sedimenti]